jgi:hypothetical protein
MRQYRVAKTRISEVRLLDGLVALAGNVTLIKLISTVRVDHDPSSLPEANSSSEFCALQGEALCLGVGVWPQ